MYNFKDESDHPLIDQRIFTQQDQDWFAVCSGDFNPVHTDPVAARRELPGDVVVHGVHLVLWALNAYGSVLTGRNISGIRLTRFHCSFGNPVYLGPDTEVRILSEKESQAKIAVIQGSQTACRISMTWEVPAAMPPPSAIPAPSLPRTDTADDPAFDELTAKEGRTPLEMDMEEIRGRYPRLIGLTGPEWTADLLAITRVVGMKNPGLHSMLSSIDLVPRTGPATDTLWYGNTETNPVIKQVRMQVSGCAGSGSVCSFFRPGVVPQLTYAEAESRVSPGEFSTQKALVIGGSRGIGEMTAKLIAAGGGDVWLTYRSGEEDARAVCKDIVKEGGHCRCSRFSTGQTKDGLAPVLAGDFRPTHVYYFATPRLIRTRGSMFNAKLFSAYADVYLTGFADLHRECARCWKQPITFFFPSSVAIEEKTPDLLEYGCAKAAAEALCASLNADRKMNPIHAVRLPMVATELSRGLLETESAKAVDVMLPVVRAMQSDALPQETGSL